MSCPDTSVIIMSANLVARANDTGLISRRDLPHSNTSNIARIGIHVIIPEILGRINARCVRLFLLFINL